MAINIYIDESGCITKKHSDEFPFFVISIIKVKNERILKTNFKRFISKNLKNLKKIDLNNKMFINGKFHEIKGSEFNKNLKLDFIKNICKNNCLEIFYIKLFNASVDVKFDKNKARVFNYLLKLFLIHEISLKNIENDNLNLQIDERNVKTQAKYSLEDYLNIELGFTNLIDKTIQVTYFDSSNNKFIQVADVFSNIFYSNCVAGSYSEELEQLKKDGYIKDIFYFPQKK